MSLEQGLQDVDVLGPAGQAALWVLVGSEPMVQPVVGQDPVLFPVFTSAVFPTWPQHGLLPSLALCIPC